MKDISKLLNDREIDFLADLFLARYGFETTGKSYRRVKNAMIALSHDFADVETELAEVARTDGITVSALVNDIERTISALPRPMHEVFNAHYSATDPTSATHVTMPENLSALDSLKFLAAVFLTIVTINYSKYEYFEY